MSESKKISVDVAEEIIQKVSKMLDRYGLKIERDKTKPFRLNCKSNGWYWAVLWIPTQVTEFQLHHMNQLHHMKGDEENIIEVPQNHHPIKHYRKS